jgi:hypothetical protein
MTLFASSTLRRETMTEEEEPGCDPRILAIRAFQMRMLCTGKKTFTLAEINEHGDICVKYLEINPLENPES